MIKIVIAAFNDLKINIGVIYDTKILHITFTKIKENN